MGKFRCLLVAPGPTFFFENLPERDGVLESQPLGKAWLAPLRRSRYFRRRLIGAALYQAGEVTVLRRDADVPLNLAAGPALRWAPGADELPGFSVAPPPKNEKGETRELTVKESEALRRYALRDASMIRERARPEQRPQRDWPRFALLWGSGLGVVLEVFIVVVGRL